jgi:Fe2+ or Zn2+ uptake regulation protein
MTCVHLRRLYELCRQNDLKLAGSDLIHIICEECGEKEVCPSEMMDELSEDSEDDQGRCQPESPTEKK